MRRFRHRLEHRWARRRLNAYVDGELLAPERRRVERHVRICPECGPMLSGLLRLAVALHDLRSPPRRSVADGVIRRLRHDKADRRTGARR